MAIILLYYKIDYYKVIYFDIITQKLKKCCNFTNTLIVTIICYPFTAFILLYYKLEYYNLYIYILTHQYKKIATTKRIHLKPCPCILL